MDALMNLQECHLKLQKKQWTHASCFIFRFFSSSHVWMWELDHKEGWAWRTDAFELWCWRRLLRVPWTAKRSNQSILKEINFEYSLEGLMLKWNSKTLAPDVKSWVIRKDPNAGKDWRQEKKEATEDEMVGWHHQLDGHEFEPTPRVGDGPGGLACCGPWGPKELHTTEWLNNNTASSSLLSHAICEACPGSSLRAAGSGGCPASPSRSHVVLWPIPSMPRAKRARWTHPNHLVFGLLPCMKTRLLPTRNSALLG